MAQYPVYLDPIHPAFREFCAAQGVKLHEDLLRQIAESHRYFRNGGKGFTLRDMGLE